jgi:DNA mismatch endonuclease (patch repair protein)
VPERWIKTEFSPFLSGRRSRDTIPELLLRSALHKAGLRFRVHRRIGGQLTADIVLPRHRVAIYVDGCFWHSHRCKYGGGKAPSGPNANAWASKFAKVKEREKRAKSILEADGYFVIRMWECVVRKDPPGAAAGVVRIVAERSQFRRERIYASFENAQPSS